MTTFPFNDPNDLPELNFMAGSNQEITFNVYTSGSLPLDISGATIKWNLAPFGTNGTSVLSKDGIIVGTPNNQFKVLVLGNDTASFSGKYVQQYVLTDTSGSILIPSQGPVNITRKLSTAVVLLPV